ncbi:MAG: hypothetical protein ABIJ18_02770 [archaeon]
MSEQIVIFRTKSDILTAKDMGRIEISASVMGNPDFIDAKMPELLAFKVISGSDYKAIEVKRVKDNPEAFMEMAFGEKRT